MGFFLALDGTGKITLHSDLNYLGEQTELELVIPLTHRQALPMAPIHWKTASVTPKSCSPPWGGGVYYAVLEKIRGTRR